MWLPSSAAATTTAVSCRPRLLLRFTALVVADIGTLVDADTVGRVSLAHEARVDMRERKGAGGRRGGAGDVEHHAHHARRLVLVVVDAHEDLRIEVVHVLALRRHARMN